MKKLIAALGAMVLSSSAAVSVVACGGGDGFKTITVGYIDNLKDKSEKLMMEKTKEKFDKYYGNLGYKIKFVRYEDENKIPELIEQSGNGKNIPDLYTATVDQAAKLVNRRQVLALEGPNSPWGEEGASILKNLHYDAAGEQHSQELLDKMEKEGVDKVDKKDQFNNFLPYAIKASRFNSKNTSKPDPNGSYYQYGITKHVGVGGGSAIVSNQITNPEAEPEAWVGKYDQLFIDLGLINEGDRRLPDGQYKWTDNRASIDKIVKYMLDDTHAGEDGVKPIFTLIDRGMWWMYPLYANAISDIDNQNDPVLDAEGKPTGKFHPFSAAKIGVNWVNDNSEGGDLSALFDGETRKDNNGKSLRYTSMFGNNHFKASTTEIVAKWYELFGAMTINAKRNLELKGDGTGTWNYTNLFDPDANAGVQKNLLRYDLAAGLNYEPGSYFDMLEGYKRFSNMDYMPLNKIELFDSENDPIKAERYKAAGLNTWLTPAGSGQYVFNSNLINAKRDKNMTKAEAAMRFVELTFGFEPKTDADGNVILDENGNPTIEGQGDGGVRNLDYQFAYAGDNPVQLAILDERNYDGQNTEFQAAMDRKVEIKFNRAKGEMLQWKDEVIGNKDLEAKEQKAIRRLEITSISLAANLYKQGGAALSLAPNMSAFDEATDGDWHGRAAMKPALEQYLKDANLDNWKEAELTARKNDFALQLMKKLAELDVNQSNNIIN